MNTFPASRRGIVSIMIFVMVASSMVSNVYAGDEKLFVNVGKLSGKTATAAKAVTAAVTTAATATAAPN